MEGYSGHSLRAGFVIEASDNGATDRQIMKQTRHKSVAMVHRYAREDQRDRQTAVSLASWDCSCGTARAMPLNCPQATHRARRFASPNFVNCQPGDSSRSPNWRCPKSVNRNQVTYMLN